METAQDLQNQKEPTLREYLAALCSAKRKERAVVVVEEEAQVYRLSDLCSANRLFNSSNG
jgi:hypothetical protein